MGEIIDLLEYEIDGAQKLVFECPVCEEKRSEFGGLGELRCSKCRTNLKTEVVVDESEWAGDDDE